MKISSLVLSASVTALLTACAAPRLPDNVATSPDGKYVDRMTFKHATVLQADEAYGRMKTCIAEHVSNEGVELGDSAGSFVGATGNYYQIDRSRTTQGGSTIQATDANTKTVIAKGVIPFSGGAPIKLAHYLKFTARAKASDGAVDFSLSQIGSAQESTGYLSNSGFSPLGIWAGSPAQDAYVAAEQLSSRVFSCIDES